VTPGQLLAAYGGITNVAIHLTARRLLNYRLPSAPPLSLSELPDNRIYQTPRPPTFRESQTDMPGLPPSFSRLRTDRGALLTVRNVSAGSGRAGSEMDNPLTNKIRDVGPRTTFKSSSVRDIAYPDPVSNVFRYVHPRF